MKLSKEALEKLEGVYNEIASSADHLKECLVSVADDGNVNADPEQLAFVGTIQEKLRQLGIVATRAYEQTRELADR